MPMFGKQIAALGLSSLLLFSGAVTAANAEETTPINTAGYTAAVEALAESGVVSGSATALQTGDGLRLAEEAGLLDGDTLSLTQLSAQALVQETEALRKENFLKENTGVLVDCNSYISLRAEPSTDAQRLRIIFDGKAARLLDIVDDEWYQVAYGSDTGYVLSEYCQPVRYEDYEGTAATNTLLEDVIAEAYSYLGTPYRYGGTSRSGIDCSGFTMKVFGAFGMKRRAVEVQEDGSVVEKKYVDIKFTMDERIVDGFYYAAFFKHYRRILAHPEILDNPPEEVLSDID